MTAWRSCSYRFLLFLFSSAPSLSISEDAFGALHAHGDVMHCVKSRCVAACRSRRRDDVTDPSLAPNSTLEARASLSGHTGAARMIRERVLTISTLLALVALSGVAQAEPKIKDKSYGGQSTSRQVQPNWHRARAMQRGAAPAQIAPGGISRQSGCRY